MLYHADGFGISELVYLEGFGWVKVVSTSGSSLLADSCNRTVQEECRWLCGVN
jgi:hypothetical protein